MVFIYKSPIGIFTISRKDETRYGLSIGDLLLGTYTSAEEAAMAVHSRTTGYDPWDRRSSLDRPTDLSQWDTLPRG